MNNISYTEDEIRAEREEAIHHFITSSAMTSLRRMEFRFFKGATLWTCLYYVDGMALEEWRHSGEVSREDLGDAVEECRELAWSHALKMAETELQTKGVR